MQQHNSVKPRFWTAILVIAALGLLLSWGLHNLYSERLASVRHTIERELQLINQMQRASIQAWRELRLTDATAISEDTLFNNSVAHWLTTGPSDPLHNVLQKHISNFLRLMQEQRGYNAAYLVSASGQLLLDSHGLTQGKVPDLEVKAMQESFVSGHAMAAEPRRDSFFGYPFFGAFAPVYDSSNNAIAAVWLVADVRKSLYPLMEKWPGSSASAESNLVMRAGDKALFLSPLRGQPNSALRFYIPLENSNSPVVQTINGMRGIFDGIDYRSQKVIAVASPINNSAWFLVSKIDYSEAFDGVLQEILGLAAPILLVLFAVALVLFYVQRQGWLRERTLKNALEQQVRIDSLTQVANRRALDEHLKAEWSRAVRQGSSLALLMIDIDHFKAFNDKYGHLEGDQCLKHVAQIISKNSSRTTDIVARYGGEEFAVILPETNIEQAVELAKRICSAVRIEAFTHVYTPDVSAVTISIGVVCMQPGEPASPSNNISSLLQKADYALYQAKRQGRDQVQAYTGS